MQVSLMRRVVERLNSEPVANQNQAPFALLPDGCGKHAPQLLEACYVPFDKGAQNNFRVAMRFEFVTERLEFLAQFGVIVDLAIECDGRVSAIGVHGLIAAGKIDNLKSNSAK